MTEKQTPRVVKELKANRKPGETKNIVVCFDGTGGLPTWAIQVEGGTLIYKNTGGLSNICKLHLYAGGNLDNSGSAVPDQISLYYKGVGTWSSSKLKQTFNSAFGNGSMEKIYMIAYKDIKEVYEEGDKIYIFGFSRGAATARLFASHLDKAENKINGVSPKVAFLGVFDTVVQSSKVGNSEAIKNLDVEKDWKKKVSSLPNCVEKAVHFVSLDERREPFNPTLFNDDERVIEVWCPGNHSDIGGGYYNDGLSDITLMCMMKEAEKAGLKFREITEETCTNDKESLVGKDDIPGLDKDKFINWDRDMKIEPDALEADVHDENNRIYRFMNFLRGFKRREVCRLKDDKPSDQPVLILDATIHRVNNWERSIPSKFRGRSPYKGTSQSCRYFPKNTKGTNHEIVAFDENKGLVFDQDKSLRIPGA